MSRIEENMAAMRVAFAEIDAAIQRAIELLNRAPDSGSTGRRC